MKNNVKTCKASRNVFALSAAAEDIMFYTLEGVIHEIEPLFTALYLSPAEETISIFNRYPDNEEIRYIVGEVCLYHRDLDLLDKATSAGFFEHTLRYLLKLSTDAPITGARLVPIFCTALEHAEELRLTEKLQKDLKQYIELRRKCDGFVIVNTDKSLTLYFAEDVIPT